MWAERHCPGLTGDERVYEDYALYSLTVAKVAPLPYEEWVKKTRSTLAGTADNREK